MNLAREGLPVSRGPNSNSSFTLLPKSVVGASVLRRARGGIARRWFPLRWRELR